MLMCFPIANLAIYPFTAEAEFGGKTLNSYKGRRLLLLQPQAPQLLPTLRLTIVPFFLWRLCMSFGRGCAGIIVGAPTFVVRGALATWGIFFINIR